MHATLQLYQGQKRLLLQSLLLLSLMCCVHVCPFMYMCTSLLLRRDLYILLSPMCTKLLKEVGNYLDAVTKCQFSGRNASNIYGSVCHVFLLQDEQRMIEALLGKDQPVAASSQQ